MKITARTCVAFVVLAGLLAAPRVGAQEWAPKLSVDLGGGVRMDFVLIKAGSFMMGDAGCGQPVHKVTITYPYYMGVCEVTQAQWMAVMGENPSFNKGDNLPVEQVSWEDCLRFLAKLQQKVGPGMICRLPCDAEWEYACRAGSTTAYCFGDDPALLGEYAWFSWNSKGKTHPVGEKKPNAWGLYDMHGNVLEWCADWYDAGFQVPGMGLVRCRLVRGNSSGWDAPAARSGFRSGRGPTNRNPDNGCRVVISAQQ